jgi:hypothetical protein
VLTTRAFHSAVLTHLLLLHCCFCALQGGLSSPFSLLSMLIQDTRYSWAELRFERNYVDELVVVSTHAPMAHEQCTMHPHRPCCCDSTVRKPVGPQGCAVSQTMQQQQ